MGWTVTPVRPPVVVHYSEDPGIEVFIPHVPATNPGHAPRVWTIEPAYAPLYWFPRDCPRVAVWAHDDAQREFLLQALGSTADRVQFARVADEAWIRSTTLCEYAFAADDFEALPDAEGHWVSAHSVEPAGRRMMGDLVETQAGAGVDLRLVENLAPVREAVLASGLPFSVVRWRA